MKAKRKIDFQELIPEVVFDNFKFCVEEKQPFEWSNYNDKIVQIFISGEECFNGIWKDNYLVAIHRRFKSDYPGFGIPFELEEFLKLTYEEFINIFKRNFPSELNNEY